MSKVRLLSIAVIVLLLINAAVICFMVLNRPPYARQGMSPLSKEGPRQVIIDRLQLDAQQTAAYNSLITSHQISIRNLEDSIGLLKNNLYQTLNGKSSASQDSLISRLGEIQKRVELVNYYHFVALKKLCRPDQLDKFNQLTTELAHFFATKKDGLPPPGGK